MREKFLVLGIALAAIALVFTGCSDSDDGPSGPTGDTTAPRILSVDPGDDDTGVATDADVVVQFDEDMDPDSADGNVTLSAGAVNDLSWDDARTLRVAHDGWPQGTRIEVTLGTGLSDVAGNGLSAAFTFGFWTLSNDLVLLDTTPEDGATAVNRNTTVSMLFSQQMNLTTLEAATSVDDGTVGRAPVAFSLEPSADDRVLMRFDATLPSQATITVTIGTGATSVGGANLAQETSFSFTTSDVVDTTPPTLVSIVPADGSTLDPSTSSLVLTFSEAIDPSRFDPSEIGAQFFYLTQSQVSEPTWSSDGTTLTVQLPTPLPAGLPIAFTFDTFYDLAGNAATQGFDYRADVAGAGDPQPFVDGAVYAYQGVEIDPVAGDFGYQSWLLLNEQPGGEFRFETYGNASLTEFYGWDVFRRTASVIEFLGFRETDEGSTFDVDLDPDVEYLRLPMAVQSWSGSTTADMGDGMVTIDYTVEVLGQEDRVALFGGFGPVRRSPFGKGVPEGPQPIWLDCWKTVLSYEMKMGTQVFSAGMDSMWYAPTIGRVRTSSVEEDFETEETYRSEEDLLFLDLFGEGPSFD